MHHQEIMYVVIQSFILRFVVALDDFERHGRRLMALVSLLPWQQQQ